MSCKGFTLLIAVTMIFSAYSAPVHRVKQPPAAVLAPPRSDEVLPFRRVEINGWSGEVKADNLRRRAAFASTWSDHAASFDKTFMLSLSLPKDMTACVELPAAQESTGVFSGDHQVAARRNDSRWILKEPICGEVMLEVR